jgi:cobalt-zinc-cadmium efflux system membrane fusion protein
VFEKDINKLYVGQKLTAFTNNEPSKKYECEILLIGQNLSAERNIEVHCHFESYDRALIPGMYMNAEIQVKSQNALSVNDDAIVSHEGKSYLFFKKDAQTFEMIQIETGVSENGFTEVITKLAGDNDQVVTKGAYSLLMSLTNRSEE